MSEVAIALDAMGGDDAPEVVVRGAHLAARRRPGARFVAFGDRARVEPLARRYPALEGRVEVRHADGAVSDDDRPSAALRRGRDTSMRLAIDALAEGAVDAVVSAGNTGALMAMSKVVLRALPGISRPAIAGAFPHRGGESVVLDLGANVECDAGNLVDFAAMGAVFARTVFGRRTPTVGILNVGEEELKGRDEVREAAAQLREAEAGFAFHGFVEGGDLTRGATDVVVTDGFTGNVALKTAEGVSRLYGEYLRRALRASWRGRLGYAVARNAFRALRERTDPRLRNGAMFLGVNGAVVKSHGGADALGFAAAIEVAVDMVEGAVNRRILDELAGVRGGVDSPDSAC